MYFCFNPISMKYFISVILTILALSCKTTNKENTTIYFGGEIINPKSNFVLFLKNDNVIDTLLLDNNNRFMANYESLEEGLYSFVHGIEFQNIYLEPKDSLLVRLNSWDFDESLVFSGRGSRKNEFLINVYLQNEKDEKNKFQYLNLNERDFQSKIDTILKQRKTNYQHFTDSETELSKGFDKVAKTAISYPLYRLKEIYPLYHKKGHQLDEFPHLSSNFYNYRNNIDLNDESLIAYHPYQNYVISYMFNLSYQMREKDSTKNNITANILNSIVNNIELEDFKNTLLKRIIVSDFIKSESSCSINKTALNVFLENCTDEGYITQIKNLVNDSKFVLNNKPLENFEIVSYSNVNSTINDIIKGKNSVIYFWSTEFMSSDYLVSRIKYLENKYPNILFIGINMQTSSENITTEPNLKLLDFTKQFKLTKKSFAHNYLTSNYPRTIIVNNKAIVKNGFTYLNSNKLSSELNKLK